jgi:hypothetical protein
MTICRPQSHHKRIVPVGPEIRKLHLVERPRARRYPFAASIELVEMESENEIREQTTNLSAFGCQLNAQKPLPAGTKVRLRIIHRGAIFAALGQIVNVRRNSMGVVFTKIEPNDRLVLEKWLAGARETEE